MIIVYIDIISYARIDMKPVRKDTKSPQMINTTKNNLSMISNLTENDYHNENSSKTLGNVQAKVNNNSKTETGHDATGLLRRLVARSNTTISYKPFYEEIKCITERSDKPCSLPLLRDYQQRCGYFAESTSWLDVEEGYPDAQMSAQICKVQPVRSAPKRLHEYITRRNITSITMTGDSQGFRYNKAMIELFVEAGFHCELQKQEAAGKKMHLDYYTQSSGFKPNVVVTRTCRTCQSNLQLCTSKQGFTVWVEYISMPMQDGTVQPIHLPVSVCKDKSQHPLCLNLTQQEYIFQYYLGRNRPYPQLILIFSAFPFTTFVTLQQGYDGIRYLLKMVTQNAPESSQVLWYGCPPWHVKNSYFGVPAEGEGLSLNDKIQLLNKFLAFALNDYYKSNRKPDIYSFFDLYHMQEQLNEKWAEDEIHSKTDWYLYVIHYTATVLPSLPIV